MGRLKPGYRSRICRTMSPCRGGPRSASRGLARDRVLADQESTAIWRASELMDFRSVISYTSSFSPPSAAAKWPAALVRARSQAPRPDAAVERRSTVAHVVPLSSIAVDLADVRALRRTPPLPADGWLGCMRPASTSVSARLDELSGVSGWTLRRDRRRSPTWSPAPWNQAQVTEQVLGHTSGSRSGIVVYQLHKVRGGNAMKPSRHGRGMSAH